MQSFGALSNSEFRFIKAETNQLKEMASALTTKVA